jgi:hypothetical protein
LTGTLAYFVRAREEDIDGAWELRPYGDGKILKVLMLMHVYVTDNVLYMIPMDLYTHTSVEILLQVHMHMLRKLQELHVD